MIKKVVHCKKEKFDVYVGRPSIWGNPYSHLNGTEEAFKTKNREESIELYEKWVLSQDHLIKLLPTLKDKVLGCWCSPKPCHADVLVKLANCIDTKI